LLAGRECRALLLLFFFFITLGLELSDTKVYEPCFFGTTTSNLM